MLNDSEIRALFFDILPFYNAHEIDVPARIRLICMANRWPNAVAACLELCKRPRSARIRRELSRAVTHMQSFGEAVKCD